MAFVGILHIFLNACIVARTGIYKFIERFGVWLPYVPKPLLVITVTSFELFVSLWLVAKRNFMASLICIPD